VLHFAHANGFPPGTYSAFAQLLTPHLHLLGMECRALWGTEEPAQFRHWREMGEDLARFLQEMGRGEVIAAGHSLGGVTSLYCAVAYPDLVRALILVDPVILPLWFSPLWWLAMRLGLNRRSRLAEGARRRRQEFASRELLLRAYRAAPVFKRWQEPFLRDYVLSGTLPKTGTEEQPPAGVQLRYPREWEARVFETPPPDVWWAIPKLRRLPVLVIRGEHSDTYRRDTMSSMRCLLPRAQFVEIEGADHFVPMCKPQKTAAAILEFCAALTTGD
jgi:pimeloyl-ACP methyl ester carboxylesterase